MAIALGIGLVWAAFKVMLPDTSSASYRQRPTALAAKARSIHQAVFSRTTEEIYITSESVWPSSSDFKSSEEFFHVMVTGGHINVGWDFFAGPGVPVAKDAEDFLAGGHNIWCVTADLTDRTAETIPFVFTKNLTIETLGDPDLYAVNVAGVSKRLGGKKFKRTLDDKGFIFATRGGSGFMLFKDQLLVGTEERPGPFRQLFDVTNPYEEGPPIATNRILRPLGY
ncbi:MAG: hypothetical protein AAF492_14630 [Verrucomicrobiota bacterium]